jgi:hypothetical protein
MATLGNILARKGGSAMTPHMVQFTLTLPASDGGAPSSEQVTVALLPVSESRKARAVNAARDYCAARAEFGDAPAFGDELVFRFLIEAMRDPEDLRKAFVEIKLIDTFRDAIVGELQTYFVGQYKQLISKEYPETLLESADEIKQAAKSVFQTGQA